VRGFAPERQTHRNGHRRRACSRPFRDCQRFRFLARRLSNRRPVWRRAPDIRKSELRPSRGPCRHFTVSDRQRYAPAVGAAQNVDVVPLGDECVSLAPHPIGHPSLSDVREEFHRRPEFAQGLDDPLLAIEVHERHAMVAKCLSRQREVVRPAHTARSTHRRRGARTPRRSWRRTLRSRPGRSWSSSSMSPPMRPIWPSLRLGGEHPLQGRRSGTAPDRPRAGLGCRPEDAGSCEPLTIPACRPGVAGSRPTRKLIVLRCECPGSGSASPHPPGDRAAIGNAGPLSRSMRRPRNAIRPQPAALVATSGIAKVA
jgi:hypothetical protein